MKKRCLAALAAMLLLCAANLNFVPVAYAAEDVPVPNDVLEIAPELERAYTLLKQFAAEQNYNADVRVLAESENVAVVFEQQPAGEKEYDASAITKEIRSFCNENQIDDSKVRVMFLLDAAVKTISPELERAYTLLSQYAESLTDGLHADVMLGQDYDPSELFAGKVVLNYSGALERDLRPMFRDFMLENDIDQSLVITVKTDEGWEFELSYELERAYKRLTEFVAKQVEKGNDIFKGVKVISASGNHPDKVIVLDTDGTNRAEIRAQTRAFMKEREIGDDLVWIQYFDSADGAASGDATCNNVVDVSDAVLAAKFATGDSKAVITDQGKLNADLDGDGSVTLDDVTRILKMITKQL